MYSRWPDGIAAASTSVFSGNLVGLPMQALAMDASIARKVFIGKHMNELANLEPRDVIASIYRPAMVFKSITPGEFEVVTGLSEAVEPLFVALKAYKTESNPMIGRGNAIMGGVAKQFTNAELKELANYIGSLPGELKTVPQAKFK